MTKYCVLLGASDYPHHKTWHHSSLPLRGAHHEMQSYAEGALGLQQNQILNLFNDQRGGWEQSLAIKAHLQNAINANPGQIVDLIVHYAGHGHLGQNEQLYFGIQSSKERYEAQTSLDAKLLRDALAEHRNRLRIFLILDCCHARKIEAVFANWETAAAQGYDGGHAGSPGVALLAASGPYDAAWAPPHWTRTVFAHLFAEALSAGTNPAERVLSMRSLCEQMRAGLGRLIARESQPSADRVLPQIVLDSPTYPETVDVFAGLTPISEAPLFQAPWPKPEDEFQAPVDDGHFTTLVVTSERDTQRALYIETRNVITLYGEEIAASAGRYTPDANKHLKELHVSGAFTSVEGLKERIQAIARADLVLFDVTQYEPGVMFLLGIRAAARRGVTICSVSSDEYERLYEKELPYNLQYLNLWNHAQHLHGPAIDDSLRKLKKKILSGVEGLNGKPHYLDLPAYDALRHLGTQSEDYEVLPHNVEVLCLTPFSTSYLRRCWNILYRHLTIQVKVACTNIGIDAENVKFVRLTERESAELVCNTLYSAVRRTAFCVVDWTGLRPNVVFEAGVRLAVGDAVHIMADLKRKPEDNSTFTTDFGVWPVEEGQRDFVESAQKLRHVRQMIQMFNPIPFRPDDLSQAEADCRRIFERFDDPFPGDVEMPICQWVGQAVPAADTLLQGDVFTGLTGRAALLHQVDEDMGRTSLLYFQENEQLRARAEKEALEMRIAAVLYLERRLGLKEIVRNRLLCSRFELEVLSIARSLQPKLWGEDLNESDKAMCEYLGEVQTRLSQLQQEVGAP